MDIIGETRTNTVFDPYIMRRMSSLVSLCPLFFFWERNSTRLTLLSSMTVFKDSIHIGSISPSSTIHLGELFWMFAKSLIATENNPKKKNAFSKNVNAMENVTMFSLNGIVKGPTKISKNHESVSLI